MKGTPGYEIVDEIDIHESDLIIGKKRPDIFLGTGLDHKLREDSVDTVIITGLISNGCVREACVSAVAKGYDVYLISDAHSTIYKNAEKIISDINSLQAVSR